jgi:ribosomal protein S18 acetylase RimI-like enzyme
MEYHFLAGIEFDSLYRTFVEAFSDYVVPIHLMTKEQLRELMTRRGADLSLSVGAFDENQLVAFNLNALDDFCGKRTVYDVMTGVVPSQRRKGIATALFRFSLPALQATNAQQYILEAIQTNPAAVATYRGIGFEISRKFEAFRRESISIPPISSLSGIEIHPTKMDWTVAQTFWDWLPSWQNSIRSIERSRSEKNVLGAFSNGNLIGYAIAYPSTGDIPQFAVRHSFRRKGVGAALLSAAQNSIPASAAARVINIEAADRGAMDFLRKIGFQNFLGQYEMKLEFNRRERGER